jgi:hypothetical protein
MFIDRTPRLNVHHLDRVGALSPGSDTTWQCHFPATVAGDLITVRVRAEVNKIVCSVNDGPEITVSIARVLVPHDRDLPLFVCGCGAHRRHLYIRADRLACRTCLGLAYACQTDRWIWKLDRTSKLRAKLLYGSMRNRKRRATLDELAVCDAAATAYARAWLRWFTHQGRKP